MYGRVYAGYIRTDMHTDLLHTECPYVGQILPHIETSQPFQYKTVSSFDMHTDCRMG